MAEPGRRGAPSYDVRSVPPVSRAWTGGRFVQMNAAETGKSHLVAEAAYAEGLTTCSGRYRTLCGVQVLATALVTAPGPACAECHRIADQKPQEAGRGRLRLLRRLAV